MDNEIRIKLSEHLDELINKAKEAKSIQELLEISDQIQRVASILLSRNYN